MPRRNNLVRAQVTRAPITSEADLYKRFLHKGSKVTYIGAFGSSYKDPVPAFIAQHSRSKALTLVDCQDMGIALKLNSIAKARGASTPKAVLRKLNVLRGETGEPGEGGLLSYRHAMQRRGMALVEKEFGGVSLPGMYSWKKRGIKLQPGLAWQTGIKPGSQTIVVDRLTNYWITKQGPGKMAQAAKHYLSLLKPNGKAIFLFETNSALKNVLKELKLLASSEGILIEFVKLDNAVKNNGFEVNGHIIKPNYTCRTALVVTKK